MTKEEALHQVAGWVAGNIAASGTEEVTGVNPDSLSSADLARIEWAMNEVCRRLWAMGRQPKD